MFFSHIHKKFKLMQFFGDVSDDVDLNFLGRKLITTEATLKLVFQYADSLNTPSTEIEEDIN